MSDRFSRFLNLERTRPQSPGGSGAVGHSGRFDAVEAPPVPGAAAEFPPSAAHPSAEAAAQPASATAAEIAAEAARAGRFGPVGPALELEDRRPEDQPFVRCAGCQADNSPFAQVCQFCGSDFNSPAQRAFNERLWAQRREEAAREAEALARLQEQRAVAEAEQAEQRRQAVGAMALQVAQQTRSRLDREEQADARRLGARHGWSPVGLAGGVSLGTILLRSAVGIFVLLLLLPGTRRYTLLASLAVAGIYVRMRWGRWRRW